MAFWDEGWHERAKARAAREAQKGAIYGGFAAGAPTGGLGAPVGALVGAGIGGLAGTLGLGGNERRTGSGPGPTEQQKAEFEMEKELRGQSWRNVEKVIDAEARGKARLQALGMDEMDATKLRDIGESAEEARAGALLQGDIFKQETSLTAKRESRLQWVHQQVQAMIAANTATEENIMGLMAFSGGDPDVEKVIRQMAATDHGKTLGGDLGELYAYATGGFVS